MEKIRLFQRLWRMTFIFIESIINSKYQSSFHQIDLININFTNCEDIFMEVHENIKFIRQFKSFSQEQMAEKLEMSLNGYAKIEQGKVDINLSRLKKISEIFGVELEKLVGLNDKNVFNFIENFQPDSIFYQQSHYNAIDQRKCQHELEKANLIIEQNKLMIEQKDKENAYLKDIIELLKKQG
ncbi:helix-turn-helix domain-containing protein [Candidatus Marithrix sp. Canyon 246]|uniref:helix-turn-helix domain-containing protein n=2 Tax=Candidatus Marithrix sp. Canyon 246 TaxID=1827136 RepID=UPI001C0ABD60|nr:helix-turn-helix transcriptional regulator [Candidatus Marithrix sp. Canyon 246]